MKKGLLGICLLLFMLNGITASDIKVTHIVEKSEGKNEYKVTTLFTGAEKADFAKASFQIPNGIKTITPSSGGSVSKKESDGISFYAFSVNEKGVETIFYIQPANDEEISIGVKFVYAVGEEKFKPNLENLIITPSKDYVAYNENTPEDNLFVIEDLDNNSTDVTAVSESGKNYSIQLLSLSDYSDKRVMKFCVKHKLKSGDLIKRKVNGVTKVSIGRYVSKEEANAAKREMIEGDALLQDAFVVALK